MARTRLMVVKRPDIATSPISDPMSALLMPSTRSGRPEPAQSLHQAVSDDRDHGTPPREASLTMT